jgi:hypothetical protein
MTAPIHASAFTRPTQHSAIARPAGWDRRAHEIQMLLMADVPAERIAEIMALFDEGEE